MTTFALQAVPENAASWLALAKRCEAAGFDALYAPDHPGVCAAPSVALAAAAAVTERIALCAYVSNAGVREAIHLAVDAATLDVVSGGRARVGLGAGHTPAEWRAIGRERPGVNERVDRCLTTAEAVRALLDDATAGLTKPRPVQDRVPLLLGTSNSRMLRWAGKHADIVGLSGLGKTLADGHRHEVRWRPDQIDHQIQQVTTGAAGRDEPPALEALVQVVAITDDAEAEAAKHADELNMTVADLLAAPFVMIGTVAEIRAAVERHEKRWGITRYAVRADTFDAIQSLGLLNATSDSR